MSINIKELTERKASEVFPNILIKTPNDTLPVVVRTLEKGDMQLVVEFKGMKKVVARVSPSGYNIDRLLRTVGTITYKKSSEEVISISTVEEYLSCI